MQYVREQFKSEWNVQASGNGNRNPLGLQNKGCHYWRGEFYWGNLVIFYVIKIQKVGLPLHCALAPLLTQALVKIERSDFIDLWLKRTGLVLNETNQFYHPFWPLLLDSHEQKRDRFGQVFLIFTITEQNFEWSQPFDHLFWPFFSNLTTQLNQ